jgi:hypothetical protein
LLRNNIFAAIEFHTDFEPDQTAALNASGARPACLPRG